jgi:hypothetical protein
VTIDGTTGRAIRLGVASGTATFQVQSAMLQVEWNIRQDVQIISTVNSEREIAGWANEITAESGVQEFGGGHGNERTTLFKVMGNGLDVTAALDDLAPRSYETLAIWQEADVFPEEAATSPKLASYRLLHLFSEGAVQYGLRLTVASGQTLTFANWLYRMMFASEVGIFTHVHTIESGMIGPPVAIVPPQSPAITASQTFGATPQGLAMSSTDHDWLCGMVVDNPSGSARRYAYAPTPWVLVNTTGGTPNNKLYSQVSGNPTPLVLTSGQSIDFSGFWFAAPIRAA